MKKHLFTLILGCLLLSGCAYAQISTVAGGANSPNYVGDGGQATSAGLNYPEFVIFDASNNMYISDANNSVIRKVTTSGVISTYAGTSLPTNQFFSFPPQNAGYSGDGGSAAKAKLHAPYGMSFNKTGNLFIADVANNAIRKITTAGIISTYAGTGVSYGYSGDGGQATNAKLYNPSSVAVDTSNGNVYIADTRNHVIRKVTTAGVISTFAGNGTAGYSGDAGQATAAKLNYPRGLMFGTTGNLYIADQMNNVVRKVITSTGVISTYAGTGTLGYTGDAAAATAATLDHPVGLGIDASGNIYIADQGNHVIRKITTAGTISTYAGKGTGATTNNGAFSGDGGAATAAELNLPSGIFFNQTHGYISDSKNNRVRKVQ